jgi:RND family efflux transporter MFP subunit
MNHSPIANGTADGRLDLPAALAAPHKNGTARVVHISPPATPPLERPPQGRRVLYIGLFVVVLLSGLLLMGVLPRLRQSEALAAESSAAASARPRVTVAVARRAAPRSSRTLPGDAQAFQQASLYARTNGYVKRWLVDIGDKVKAGDLLAEITAPDVDAQLEQARANLLQSKANLLKATADETYARSEETRNQALIRRQAVSQSEYDSQVATTRGATAQVEATAASIKVNEANVQKLLVLQSFQKLTAPFSGVITARNLDTGNLVVADNASGKELYHVAQIDPLRVFVDVPQVFATDVKVGQEAVVFRREEPGRRFTGKVTRTANALEPATRTLRTQVDVPNPDGALLPGMYLQVTFTLQHEVTPVLVPTAALVIRTAGPKVAVLDAQDRVSYRDVQLGRDYGAEVEVTAGLRDGEAVILHPGDDLPEGTAVRPATRQELASEGR